MCGGAKRMCHAGASAARSQCAYAVVHVATLFLFARGDKRASESLGRAQQLLHPAALYTDCTKGLCAQTPGEGKVVGGRWRREEKGTTVHNT